MNAVQIQSFTRVVPMIYAYQTPEIARHNGWTKIGYTEKQSVEDRIGQQTHTADVRYVLAWQDNAMFKDGSGEYFTDHDFHAYLETEANVERTPGTEWFHVDGNTSRGFFDKFTRRESAQPEEQKLTYALRKEQAKAVKMTKDYFANGGVEFLWNAKPRFGKTLTAYDLVQTMGFEKVLIVTNRPSIANSWAEDFRKFVGWHEKYCFVSDTDALAGKPGVTSRDDYIRHHSDKGMIAFESLQGLKGSVYFGGQYDKLKWMSELAFDLLIVDESQEGIETMRTEQAFRNIHRKHTLYLSGTPFKQLAGEQFREEQIFNWSYADEQEAKKDWDGEDANPYAPLPRLAMFTYQLSGMIRDQISRGAEISDDETVDYAFDLNEFFATNESGKFLHEEEIKKFLHALSTQEKYPFSTPELRDELKHTMWYLNRVASAKALAKLLHDDPVFGEYEIVLAAGDGRMSEEDEAEKAYDRVKQAIAEHDKTITLTVGQLTVGITIPEWSGVLMLCNLQSPSSYMQAAFRAQNPCIVTRNGQRFRKETAYIFDFDPARTLIIFDDFANNLRADTAQGRGTTETRANNIKRLLNFFPVLGEDSEGRMVELDAAQVLSIPRRLKSQEVVRHGFLSNFLFKNISNIFGAPGIVRQILEKIQPAQEEQSRSNDAMNGMEDITVDDNGEVEVPNEIVIGKATELFGDKVFETVPQDMLLLTEDVQLPARMSELASKVKQHVSENLIAPAAEQYGVTKGFRNRVESQIAHEIDRKFEVIQGDYETQQRIAKAELEQKRAVAETPQQLQQAEADYEMQVRNALKILQEVAMETAKLEVAERPKEVIERFERREREQEKRKTEDEVRAHLRGFARTIPSFIMAYDDGNLTLANFDDYTEDDVFAEVTGITEDDFRFLRDGGDYPDEETGEMQHFEGHLFDEIVFDDSIDEFRKKRQQLADYFDETQEEDIFDYIPPQKTNQIFTPRWVVQMMVDQLEENNPGCFDDPKATFADLYMKSGLYITEIVKRLFRSEGLKKAFPDDGERIRHILREQVYGMAPTRIIYLIATNYILGFDETLKNETKHFVQADAAEAAKNGALEALVNEYFGA